MAKSLLVSSPNAKLFQIGILFASILNPSNCRLNRFGFRDIVEYTVKDFLRWISAWDATNGAVNEDSSCTGQIQEIFDYMEMGEKLIEKPESPDVIIVVGLSGVGKSTFVQFIGNATNELISVCDPGGNCKLFDETGLISNDSLISKTFLPNLVVNSETKIPFYDMPGFDDNRNAPVEIANSFFMQHALEACKRIKILILASHGSFDSGEKQSFKNLLENFVKLFKNPAKYAGSIAMVSTKADQTKNNSQLLWTYSNFLNVTLKSEIDQLFDEDIIRVLVNQTIDAILESETENIDDLKHLGYFISPKGPGPLQEQDAYILNLERLKDLVHNNRTFMEKDSSDFGIPLTADAVLLLERAYRCITEAFITSVILISTQIEEIVLENIQMIHAGDLETLDYTTELLQNISYQDYSFVDVEDETVSFYVEKLQFALSVYNMEMINEAIEEIGNLGNMLQFISQTETEVSLKPEEWIAPLKSLNETLKIKMAPIAVEENNLIEDSVTTFSSDIKIFLTQSFQGISEGLSVDVETVHQFVTSIQELNFTLDVAPDQSASDISQQLIAFLKEFPLPSLSATIEKIETSSTVLDLLSILDASDINPPKWINKLKDLKVELHEESMKYQSILNETTVATLSEFADNLTFRLNSEIEDLRTGQSTNFDLISLRLKLLSSANFDFLEVLNQSSDFYFETAITSVEGYAFEMSKEFTRKFSIFSRFSNILETALNTTTLDTKLWKIILESSSRNIILEQQDKAIETQQLIFEGYKRELESCSLEQLSRISSFKDIYSKQSELSELKSSCDTIYEDIQDSLTTQQFKQFIDESSRLYSSLGCFDYTSSSLEMLLIYDSISDFGWKSNQDWQQQLKVSFLNQLTLEADVTDFLILLRYDLQHPIIQIDSDMSQWWNAQQGQMGLSIFTGIWFNYLSETGLNSIRNRDLTTTWHKIDESLDGVSRIVNLLNLVLQPNFKQSTGCSPDGIITKNFLSMKDIKECAAGKSSVMAFALNTMYFNEKFVAFGLMKAGATNVFLYSPLIFNTNQNLFDLSGPDAVGSTAPLPSGSPGGTFYLLFQNVSVGSSAGENIRVETNGGKGATGLTGKEGNEGRKGDQETFNANDDCGYIHRNQFLIRKPQYSCRRSSSGYCTGGNEENPVEIYGTVNPGERGGDGGSGSNGGGAGATLIEQILLKIQGLFGDNGDPGSGGPGGVGGIRGNTLEVYVTTYIEMGVGKCIDRGRFVRPGRGDRGDRGSIGPFGSPNRFVPEKRNVDVTKARGKLSVYRNQLAAFGDNEFFWRETNDFLIKLAEYLKINS